jgi:hypothetical protein
MALLAILFLLFGFVFLGVGTGSSGTTDLIKPVVKCSKRMPVDGPAPKEPRRRCGPPPANP